MIAHVLSRFLSLFETSRQIDVALRAAEEFERARNDHSLSGDPKERASTVTLL
jgi:hypothetical protein